MATPLSPAELSAGRLGDVDVASLCTLGTARLLHRWSPTAATVLGLRSLRGLFGAEEAGWVAEAREGVAAVHCYSDCEALGTRTLPYHALCEELDGRAGTVYGFSSWWVCVSCFGQRADAVRTASAITGQLRAVSEAYAVLRHTAPEGSMGPDLSSVRTGEWAGWAGARAAAYVTVRTYRTHIADDRLSTGDVVQPRIRTLLGRPDRTRVRAWAGESSDGRGVVGSVSLSAKVAAALADFPTLRQPASVAGHVSAVLGQGRAAYAPPSVGPVPPELSAVADPGTGGAEEALAQALSQARTAADSEVVSGDGRPLLEVVAEVWAGLLGHVAEQQQGGVQVPQPDPHGLGHGVGHSVAMLRCADTERVRRAAAQLPAYGLVPVTSGRLVGVGTSLDGVRLLDVTRALRLDQGVLGFSADDYVAVVEAPLWALSHDQVWGAWPQGLLAAEVSQERALLRAAARRWRTPEVGDTGAERERATLSFLDFAEALHASSTV